MAQVAHLGLGDLLLHLSHFRLQLFLSFAGIASGKLLEFTMEDYGKSPFKIG